MKKIIHFLIPLIAINSCTDKAGTDKYYTKAKWQKFRKEYDQGKLNNKPLEIKETGYVELEDTLITSTGKNNGYELFRFNTEGDMALWKSFKSDSEWVNADMNYDENGLQSRYYTNRDSLKTFSDAGKVVSRKINKGQFLLHSYFNIGPAYLLVSFRENGNVVKKEYIIDSSRLDDVLKTVTAYYKDDQLQKIETKTKDGFTQIDNYYYSANHFLDSSNRLMMNKLNQKEFFVNNKFGDPVSYVLQRFPKQDTIQYVKLQYEYDSRGNWVKRLENKIIGNYATAGRNPHHTLVVRNIKYP